MCALSSAPLSVPAKNHAQQIPALLCEAVRLRRGGDSLRKHCTTI